eukprot:CAMPEP_0174286006 /NCGR_PEP_ID=MMETSP0809-20121228/10351_1 /TAXON_ID=73025 ORGANISM="Eutreptiella gymnastica-like, Strain CCMP1594" /NCGR_SAMPLE_ID=MMETSP0809 /ASSEMBLY_ACC=CAM_ASM_000658 /LENGTH=139 /DNA_ID=CAMNT_0015381919 /DNA_START=35 /DNA_END=454 /DNA_ORIENTATION=-
MFSASPYSYGVAPAPQFMRPAMPMVPAVQTPPAPAPAPAVELPEPPKGTPKLSVTPDRVEKLLEQAYARLETLGNQLRAAASELEEIRAEILTANNLCDSELRSQLQQANDEIYKLRNSLAECAERKVNKMDKKELMDI